MRGGGSARTLEWMRQVGERPGGRPPGRTAAAEAGGRGLHRARATTVAAVAAIVLSYLVGPVDHATADLYAVTPGSRSPSAGTLALDAGDWDVQPDAYRGGWVVMQPWEFARIPALKKQNPDIRVLMYKDVSATVSTICVTGPRGRGDVGRDRSQRGRLTGGSRSSLSPTDRPATARRSSTTGPPGSWLLAWNGEDGASFYVPEESGVSFRLRPAIKNIGLPTGPRVTVGHPGDEVRPYTHGVAVVNSSDHDRSIPLGGTYLRHFEPVDRLELGPRSAAVLRSVGR